MLGPPPPALCRAHCCTPCKLPSRRRFRREARSGPAPRTLVLTPRLAVPLRGFTALSLCDLLSRQLFPRPLLPLRCGDPTAPLGNAQTQLSRAGQHAAVTKLPCDGRPVLATGSSARPRGWDCGGPGGLLVVCSPPGGSPGPHSSFRRGSASMHPHPACNGNTISDRLLEL